MINLDPQETHTRRKQRIGLLAISIIAGGMPLGGTISIALAGLTANSRAPEEVSSTLALFCVWLLVTCAVALGTALTGFFRRDKLLQVAGFFMGLGLWGVFLAASSIIVFLTKNLGS